MATQLPISEPNDANCSTHLWAEKIAGEVMVMIPTSTPEEAERQLQLEWKTRGELESRISELSIEQSRLTALVDGLRQELAALKAMLPTPCVSQIDQFDPSLSSLISVTESLFAKPIVVETETDPDDPDSVMAIFNVKCEGDAKALVAKEMEWNRQVARLKPGSFGHIRLIVSPIE